MIPALIGTNPNLILFLLLLQLDWNVVSYVFIVDHWGLKINIYNNPIMMIVVASITLPPDDDGMHLGGPQKLLSYGNMGIVFMWNNSSYNALLFFWIYQ